MTHPSRTHDERRSKIRRQVDELKTLTAELRHRNSSTSDVEGALIHLVHRNILAMAHEKTPVRWREGSAMHRAQVALGCKTQRELAKLIAERESR